VTIIGTKTYAKPTMAVSKTLSALNFRDFELQDGNKAQFNDHFPATKAGLKKRSFDETPK
jgi:hypothetical protein